MSEQLLLPLVGLADYGVLGTQLTADKKLAQVAPEPDEQTAIVDPAGLAFIQAHGPSRARGASGAIYEWLGIKSEEAFPEPVRAAVRAAGQAKLHRYGTHLVIHVVGPNLHMIPAGPDAAEAAIEKLAGAYASTLAEFASSGAVALRMLPVSGGIFAGRFADDIPWMTFDALEKGFASLPEAVRDKLLLRFRETKLELCIFGEGALPEFAAGLASGGAVPAGGPKALSTLWPGALAVISGLTSDKALHFNGTVCTVLEVQGDGKYLAELEGGQKATLPIGNLSLAEGGGLVPGIKAIISGLKKEEAQKYNGGEALLKGWSREYSKWVVKLPDGNTAPLPATNLRVAPAPPEAEAEEFPIDLF